MRDWREFWNTMPRKWAETDFLQQVGKTVNGQPVSEAQVDEIVRQLCTVLACNSKDRVLDLCCGNGLLTHRVAAFCHKVVAVDYSGILIEVARKYHQPSNVSYVQSSVLDLSPELLGPVVSFTKVYMYEALQHFGEEDLEALLRVIRKMITAEALVYFCSVPDKERIWHFYNTPELRDEYYRRKAEGREAMGTWWEYRTLESIAASLGFRCNRLSQSQQLYTAHYRYDVLLTRDR